MFWFVFYFSSNCFYEWILGIPFVIRFVFMLWDKLFLWICEPDDILASLSLSYLFFISKLDEYVCRYIVNFIYIEGPMYPKLS